MMKGEELHQNELFLIQMPCYPKWHENSLSIKDMKTIAITEWDKGVSPLFDAACSLCIITAEGKRTIHTINALSLVNKADLCVKQGVDILICGAISSMALGILIERGICVISWICGPVNAVVDNYRQCGDIDERFVMPGCRKQRCEGKSRRACHQKHRAAHCIQPKQAK